MIVFILNLFWTTTNAQDLKYKVSFLAKDIGFVTVSKELKNDSAIYYFNSETEVSFLFMSLKTKAI